MMDTLSDEVLLLIFNNLNLRDILTCSLVNKQFYRIVYDEELWKNIGQVDFGKCYHKLYLNNNYHQTYKLCYDLTKLKTILELKEMISDFYHWNNILLNEKQTNKIDEKFLILRNLKYLHISIKVTKEQEDIIGKMNLTKVQKFDEKSIRGRFSEFILLGIPLDLIIDGQRLYHIEDGLAEILMEC